MTEKGKSNNAGELINFIHTHKLMDNHSNMTFRDRLTLVTENNKIESLETYFIATNDGYNNACTLIIHEDLDSDLYPTRFDGNWQKFEHVDNMYLQITGSHSQNPKIGKYEAKILPIAFSKLP